MSSENELENPQKVNKPITIAWTDESNGVGITLDIAKHSSENKPEYKLPFKITKNVATEYTTYSIAVPNDIAVKVKRTETDTLQLVSTKNGKREWKFEPSPTKFAEYDPSISKGNIKARPQFPGWEDRCGATPVTFLTFTTDSIKIKSISDEFATSPKGSKRPLTESDGQVKQKKICKVKRIPPSEGRLFAEVPVGSPKSLGPIVPILNDRSFSKKKPSEFPKRKQNQTIGPRRSTSSVPNGTVIPCKQINPTKSREQISLSNSNNKPTRSQKAKQTQSSESRRSTSSVPNGTSTLCEDEENRTLLTLKPLSDNDTLFVALSVALGKKPKRNVPKVPKPDPFCWQCHEFIKVGENGERQGQECEFCQISFCHDCLAVGKKKPERKYKRTSKQQRVFLKLSKPKNPNVQPRAKFPPKMPQMESECNRLISQKWLALLAKRKVCHNCVDRVAHALFNRTLGFMQSDFHRKDNNVVFSDVVGLLKDKIKQENKSQVKNLLKENFEPDCYNILDMVSKNHRNVVAPMTLKMMDTKAANHEYRSTIDFMFDIDMILHNFAIENGAPSVEKDTVNKIHGWLKNELHSVDTCVTCYRNYYITPEDKTDDNGIEVPCGNPHSIVWGKWRGKYWLPGKVLECRLPESLLVKKKKVYVQFFAQKSEGNWLKPQIMNIEDLYLYSRKLPPQDVKNITTEYQQRLTYGKELVEKFRGLLNLFYDNSYVVPKEPVQLTEEKLYIPDIGQYHEDEVRSKGYFTQ